MKGNSLKNKVLMVQLKNLISSVNSNDNDNSDDNKTIGVRNEPVQTEQIVKTLRTVHTSGEEIMTLVHNVNKITLQAKDLNRNSDKIKECAITTPEKNCHYGI